MSDLSLLVSYHFARSGPDRWDGLFEEAFAAGMNIMLDSGAFSAYQLNKPINLDDYLEYLRTRRHLFRGGYVALDVISSGEQSMQNLRSMADAGFRPIPVLTQDMPIERASELLDIAQNQTLCVAGGTIWEDAAIAARYTLVNKAVPQARIHGLGFTRSTLAWRTPVFSVDSSSWVSGGRYGLAMTFDLMNGTRYVDFSSAYRNGWGEVPTAVRRIMEESGVGPSNWNDFIIGRSGGSWVTLQGASAWLKYRDHMISTGRRFYFATSVPNVLFALASAQMHRTPSGGVKYPDGCTTYLRLQQMYRKDRSSFWRYFVRDIDWSKR